METYNKIKYNEAKIGISIVSMNEVEVIGECILIKDNVVYEQYLYNIIGYIPNNGKPFMALKSNIILRNGV